MRRYENGGIDIAALLNSLKLTTDLLQQLEKVVKFLSDEALVETFAFSRLLGKRAWLIQASILHEARARSVYGDQALLGVARRFEISLREAEKYAAVWATFFTEQGSKNVNIDEFVLEEPSWYIVAATETQDPHAWLAYAQDRKLSDPRFTVATLRRDIQASRLEEGVQQARSAAGIEPDEDPNQWRCPWIRRFCTKSGRPVPSLECQDCEVRVRTNLVDGNAEDYGTDHE